MIGTYILLYNILIHIIKESTKMSLNEYNYMSLHRKMSLVASEKVSLYLRVVQHLSVTYTFLFSMKYYHWHFE